MNLIPFVDVAWRASQPPQRDFSAPPEGRRNFSGHQSQTGGGQANGRDADAPDPAKRPATADPARGHIVDVFAR